MTEDELDELRETYDHFDRDSNGRIDRNEFSQLVEALDANVSEEECGIGFDAVDEDQNGTIEFSEFIAWWTDR